MLVSPAVVRAQIDKHMLKILKQTESAKLVKFNLHGGFTGEYVPEVEKALSKNDRKKGKVALDLMNVTFVDREAMEFLRRAISRKKIEIENIPSYVKRWIEQEVS
ncbi:MAG TPA: hypothetical protein VF074_04925 [Pyrinomonadaceae bacterium]